MELIDSNIDICAIMETWLKMMMKSNNENGTTTQL